MLVQWPSSSRWRTACIAVWHHLTIVTVGQRMQALLVDHSEQLLDSFSTCDVNRGYYMLLLFFCCCCCSCFFYYFLFFGIAAWLVQVQCRLIDQLSMNLWVWHWSVDFRFGLSYQGFCILHFILSEFLTKGVLKCIVNPIYLIGCCSCTVINLVLNTIVLIFNATHKMGCCEYCYWLGWSENSDQKKLRFWILFTQC